jgi:hypothetical protein
MRTSPRSSVSPGGGSTASMAGHPLFVFNPFDDLERCALRPGWGGR